MVLKNPLRSKRRFNTSTRAFTLAEVMVAAFVMVIGILGIMGAIMLSLRQSLETRFRDRAYNALASVADQFQNSPIIDQSSATKANKVLFATTGGNYTSSGLAWDTSKQCFTYPLSSPPANILCGSDTSDLVIPLGTVGQNDTAIQATLKRKVETPAINDPLLASVPINSPAGSLVQGTFTITYTLLSRTRTLQITVLRNINPSDS